MNEIENEIENITNELEEYCTIISNQDFPTTANIQTELMRSGVDRGVLLFRSFFTRFSFQRVYSCVIVVLQIINRHIKYPFMIYKTHQAKTDESKLKGVWEALKWTLGLPKFYINAEWVHFKDLD